MKLINSDCIIAMKEMPDNSVDSIVTDPPYELGFMGKSWDSTGIANSVEMWSEALRVLKPGGHLIAFSGSRTYHRMAVAIEDAGFEIRDQIMWVYGSGFPKSHNISKAIDKDLGKVRINGKLKFKGGTQLGVINDDSWEPKDVYESKPVSDLAQQWDGWGTALKPAHEPIVLARKPFPKGYTVAQNVLEFGTGGLNIDASRVAGEPVPINKLQNWSGFGQEIRPDYEQEINNAGRFPANFIHDGLETEWAKFFYCAKANKTDRNEGVTNNHPTVKPIDLMRYLVRMITPPNGTVLDPFMGSGSTGKACAYEGFEFIGIDQSNEYVDIARARIEFALQEEDTKEDELPF